MVEGELKKYGIDHLHYMAPMDNAALILVHGILSYNNAKAVPHRSVALVSVQEWRESMIPGTGKRIHDYVPLYFATHTPMQYVITTPAPMRGRAMVLKQRDLVFIEVDATKVFSLLGVIFTDGNAASNETNFYSDISDLDKLDWDSIWRPNTFPHCYDPEWKRKKASEVLVPDRMPIEFFSSIVVFSQAAKSDLVERLNALRKGCRKNFQIIFGLIHRNVSIVLIVHIIFRNKRSNNRIY